MSLLTAPRTHDNIYSVFDINETQGIGIIRRIWTGFDAGSRASGGRSLVINSGVAGAGRCVWDAGLYRTGGAHITSSLCRTINDFKACVGSADCLKIKCSFAQVASSLEGGECRKYA